MQAQDPHSFADLEQGKITHLDLLFDVDFSTNTLHGEVHYQIDRPITGSFFLDCSEIALDKVHANGKEISWEVDESDQIRGQRLHLKDLKAVSAFSISFKTDPGARALQWLRPEQTSGGEQPFLFSQCQPLHARSIFPCQDSPAVRFTYTAEIRVPPPLIAVMAAAPLSVKTVDGVNVCHFEMPQPIPSYLFALGVGNITSKDLGERCRIYAEPNMIEAAAWEFAEVESMLTEAEKLFGPYIWDRYDMLLMPPSFPFGGMENPRLTFVTPTILTGDRSQTMLIAHELAHSWTGNLVTNATWEDFWLNEGWTVYAEQRILEILEGREYEQLMAAINREEMMMAIRRFGVDADPTRLKFPQKGIDPDAVYSLIPYIKGHDFLVMLEQSVGRDRFDRFIQEYISTYKFQSLTTEKFIVFLKEKLPEAVAKVDVEEWIYEPGYPDGGPAIHSDLMEEVVACVAKFKEGMLPTHEDVQGWNSNQIRLFLYQLPRQVSLESCRYLESLFSIATSKNFTHLSAFYEIAIRSGYEAVLPRVEEILETIGRGKFVVPLMRALAETEWSKAVARPIFERVRNRHHPLTVANLERVLVKAGL
jgi:leukotriene-A4 hydrolase